MQLTSAPSASWDATKTAQEPAQEHDKELKVSSEQDKRDEEEQEEQPRFSDLQPQDFGPESED